MTNTFGWPGTDRSGSTLTRPARSISTSVCSARSRPSGLACTPADHTLVCDSMRRIVPSESLTVMPLRSTSVTMAPSWISTPIFSSLACAFLPSFSPMGGSTAGAASSRITRAVVESICRNAPLSVWSASSAICPAISTPVGPAPTTMKVSSFSRRAGSLDRSACSNAPRMRARSSSASSIDFMPGAHSAK